VVTGTVNVRALEGVPFDPFCAVTVKVPGPSAVFPFSCVDERTSVLGAKLQVANVHPGPLNITITLLVSKPLPMIVKLKACPFTGGFGVVVMLVS